MLRIGLTGGIGSGKSTVAGLLVRQGAALVDADAISRRLTQPGGAAIPALAAEFGAGIVDTDGALDRNAMRQLVFADAEAKRRLEAILHPLIGAETQAQAEAAQAPAIVFDVPLLVESAHWRTRVQRILVVDCEESTQVERVTARSGLSSDAVLSIIAQQASRQRRRACADAVIYNDAITLQGLATHVDTLWRFWVRANA
jgi:dephospho-CoA kinase